MIAVIFVRGERWDPDRALEEQDGLSGHVEFIRRRRDEGVVIEAGPFHEPASRVTDELLGLALLDLESVEDARSLVDADPVVQAGAFAYLLFPWGGKPLRR